MSAKKPYFNTCLHCGAHLDPGERCDCMERVDNNSLIQQVNWLLDQMSKGQILQVLSFTNRVFVKG